jgi:hypothetical protein
MSADVETRSVELAEIQAGVRLRTGRPVLLVVKGIKEGGFLLEVQLHAAGGTPLANERVRIHDPDTGEQVGEAATTDASGVLRARVPAEKEYQIHLDDDPAEDHGHDWGDMAAPARSADRDAVLDVQIVDGAGEPVKGLAVHMRGEGKEDQEAVTGDDGRIHMAVEPGVYTLEAGGTSFVAHSVFHDEIEGGESPYRFTLG